MSRFQPPNLLALFTYRTVLPLIILLIELSYRRGSRTTPCGISTETLGQMQKADGFLLISYSSFYLLGSGDDYRTLQQCNSHFISNILVIFDIQFC